MFDLVEIDDIYVFPEVIIAEWEGKPRCLPAALAYAANGWLVFPAPRSKKKSHKVSRAQQRSQVGRHCRS